jgi:hypothetical protein
VPDPQTVTTLSLGTNALTAFELEPSSNYRVACPKGYFINVDATPYVAADEDNYVHMQGGVEYVISSTGAQFQLAVIADAESDAPALPLELDDPGALLMTLTKFTPVVVTPPGG